MKKPNRYSPAVVWDLIWTIDRASVFFNTLVDHPCRQTASPEEVEQIEAHLTALADVVERMRSQDELTTIGVIRHAIRKVRKG